MMSNLERNCIFAAAAIGTELNSETPRIRDGLKNSYKDLGK